MEKSEKRKNLKIILVILAFVVFITGLGLLINFISCNNQKGNKDKVNITYKTNEEVFNDSYYNIKNKQEEINKGSDLTFKIEFEQVSSAEYINFEEGFKYENLKVIANGQEYSTTDGNFTIPKLNKDTQIKISYPVVYLNVLGEVKKVLLNRGEKIYETLESKTIYNDETTCGFYLEEYYLEELSSEETIESEINIYTAVATNNYLTFNENETGYDASAFYESGNSNHDVTIYVVPKKYNDKYLTSIGYNKVFWQCGVEQLILPSYITKINNDSCFGYRSGLRKINIPSKVEELGDNIFWEESQLTDIYISENSKLKSIGKNAFEGCCNLNTILLPKGLESIGENAFINCTGLIEIINLSQFQITKGSEDNGFIGKNAFCVSNNTNSNWVEENGVRYLANENKTELVCFKLIDETKTDIQLNLKTIKIFEKAFENCNNLKSIQMPACLTEIGDHAFENCNNLKSIQMSTCLTKIGSYAFNGCSKLDNIQLASTINTIGIWAFYQCTSLTKVNIPSNLKKIEKGTFCQCTSLSEVVFDSNENLESIGECAFAYCCFESINLPNSLESFDTDNYFYVAEFEYWDPEIGDYNCPSISVFGFNTNLKEITIPSKITTIQRDVFSSLPNLEKIKFRENSQIMPKLYLKYFIKYCPNLKEITIPKNVEMFYGFSSFENLEKIYFEDAENWEFRNYTDSNVYTSTAIDPEQISSSETIVQFLKNNGDDIIFKNYADNDWNF